VSVLESDYETAINTDDRLELRVWLRLLTCSNLIDARVRRGLRDASTPPCRASICWRSSTARPRG